MPVETITGTELQWRVYDKKRLSNGAYNAHICKKEDLPKPEPRPIKAWWNDD